jgi:hypothetical protein
MSRSKDIQRFKINTFRRPNSANTNISRAVYTRNAEMHAATVLVVSLLCLDRF